MESETPDQQSKYLRAIKLDINNEATFKLRAPWDLNAIYEKVSNALSIPTEHIQQDLKFIYEDSENEEIVIQDELDFTRAVQETKKKELRIFVTSNDETLCLKKDLSRSLADGSIGSDKIAENAIQSEQLSRNSVTFDKLDADVSRQMLEQLKEAMKNLIREELAAANEERKTGNRPICAAVAANFPLSASSFYEILRFPSNCGLHSDTWWVPYTQDQNQWISINVIIPREFFAIETQGCTHWTNQWVTSYTVDYSIDGVNWMKVDGGRTFTANEDKSTVMRNEFTTPVRARTLRICPKTWNKYASMRLEIYFYDD